VHVGGWKGVTTFSVPRSRLCTSIYLVPSCRMRVPSQVSKIECVPLGRARLLSRGNGYASVHPNALWRIMTSISFPLQLSSLYVFTSRCTVRVQVECSLCTGVFGSTRAE